MLVAELSGGCLPCRCKGSGDLAPRADVELAVGSRELALDRAHGDDQLGGDLSVRASGGGELGNGTLGDRQLGPGGRSSSDPPELVRRPPRPRPRRRGPGRRPARRSRRPGPPVDGSPADAPGREPTGSARARTASAGGRRRSRWPGRSAGWPRPARPARHRGTRGLERPWPRSRAVAAVPRVLPTARLGPDPRDPGHQPGRPPRPGRRGIGTGWAGRPPWRRRDRAPA